jgi:RNA polymerase sigma-70 factor (ECF subfamily)
MLSANVIRLPSRPPGLRRAVAEREANGVAAGTDGQARADEMAALLLAVAERQDHAAFAALFRHFAPRVKAYLMRFGDDAGRADEVVQETFVAVWRRAATFNPARASAATWIFTIARNRRIDAFRRERRPEFDPSDPAFVPEPEPQAEERAIARQRRESLAAALAELSEEQREVLRLSFFESSSHEAIAARLGLPVGTVKSRIRLAYGHLRARLAAKAGGLP